MNWRYHFPSRVAEHIPSGTTYNVAFEAGTGEISISPVHGEDKAGPAERDALIKLCQQEKDRSDLGFLMRELFANDHAKAVVVLNEIPGRKATVRSLQAWQIAPGRKSSRTCPSWVVAALKDYQRTHAAEIQAFREFTEHRREASNYSRSRVDIAYNDRGVAEAERRLVTEEAYQDRFKSASMVSLPTLVAEELLKVNEKYDRLLDNYFALLGSIRSATSFDELKTKFSAEEDDIHRSENFVRTTYLALKNGEAEFASEDGTLPETASLASCVYPGR